MDVEFQADSSRNRNDAIAPKQTAGRTNLFDQPANWQDMSRDANWSLLRIRLAKVLNSQSFGRSLNCILVIQSIIITWETDLVAQAALNNPLSLSRESESSSLLAVALAFLFFYIIEILIRIYVERGYFVADLWNMFDCCVVLLDIAKVIICGMSGEPPIPCISLFRILRIVRAFRNARLLRTLPYLRELFLMLHALTNTMRAVAWGCLLTFPLLTLWSILAVQVIHPLVVDLAKEGQLSDCPRCPHAFQSVFRSNLTFLRIMVVGDSWSELAAMLLERHPWTVLVFVPVFATINLGMLNLVLTVIVDCVLVTRAQDDRAALHATMGKQVQEAKDQMQECKKELTELIKSNFDSLRSEFQVLRREADESGRALLSSPMLREQQRTQPLIAKTLVPQESSDVSSFNICDPRSSPHRLSSNDREGAFQKEDADVPEWQFTPRKKRQTEEGVSPRQLAGDFGVSDDGPQASPLVPSKFSDLRSGSVGSVPTSKAEERGRKRLDPSSLVGLMNMMDEKESTLVSSPDSHQTPARGTWTRETEDRSKWNLTSF